MGHGLFEKTLYAELCKRGLGHVGVQGEYSTGQKERRIIDSLVSAAQRHRIILHKQVFESDIEYGKQHAHDKRNNYSLFYQISSITTERNSLVQDDRVEALAGAVRHWKEALLLDEHKAAEARRQSEAREFVANPLGHAQAAPRAKGTRSFIQARRSRRS